MTREDLKQLIRECLVEIVTEGAKTETTRVRMRESAAKVVPQEPPRRRTIGGMSLDRPAMPQGSPRQETRQLQTEAVARATSRITSDPVLASIFADTAATTLQTQTQAEKMGTASVTDPFAAVASQRDMKELFGESAQNWAALAFSGTATR